MGSRSARTGSDAPTVAIHLPTLNGGLKDWRSRAFCGQASPTEASIGRLRNLGYGSAGTTIAHERFVDLVRPKSQSSKLLVMEAPTAEDPAVPVDAIERAEDPKFGPKAPSRVSSFRASGIRRMLNSRVAAAAAFAALASVVAARWWFAPPGESDPAEPASAVAARAAIQPAPPVALKPPVVASGGAAKESESLQELKATVQRLKDQGNWNVFVLHASKWAREEPSSAAAWSALSTGYARLHQLDDALSAAAKAAELSPGDPALWRNVGHLSLALERLPEAGGAFDKVLAVNSADAAALCGSALVAHRLGRAKDAFAIAGRIKSAGGSCEGLSDGESVPVVVKAPAVSSRQSSVRRQH
jgi:hypothetical protein